MHFAYKYVYFCINISTHPHPPQYAWGKTAQKAACFMGRARRGWAICLSRTWSRLFQSLTPEFLVITQSLRVTCLFSSLISTTVYNRMSASSGSAAACVSCPAPWVRPNDVLLRQEETAACVMLSIVCSPLGSFLTKTKILFAKYMGVEEKVRWLLGLWCFCHYRKVCSAR